MSEIAASLIGRPERPEPAAAPDADERLAAVAVADGPELEPIAVQSLLRGAPERLSSPARPYDLGRLRQRLAELEAACIGCCTSDVAGLVNVGISLARPPA